MRWPAIRVPLPPGAASAWLVPGLPWLCLVMMPLNRLVEIPVLTTAALAVWLLARRRLDWTRHSPLRLFTAVFASVWVPMAISLIGAAAPLETLRVVVSHLRLYLAGVFLIHALSSPGALTRFVRLCAWLLVFWIVDAVCQWGTGVDLFGQPPVERRITGPFGLRSAKFGIVLAVLAPLLLAHALAHWPRWAAALTVLGTVLVVFVSGTRAAWVVGLVAAGGWWVLAWRRQGRIPWRATFAGLLVAGTVVTGAVATSSTLAQRFQQVVGALSGDRLASPLAHRGWIWKGGWAMFLAKPVNGVGARGFRYAFPAHAAADDPFMAADPPHLPTHSHNVLLEVLAETGVVGLAGLLLAGTMLARAAGRLPAASRPLIVPFGMALVLVFWPVNTHPALFSAMWSQFVWWLAALYCAAYGTARALPNPDGTDPFQLRVNAAAARPGP